MLTTAGAWQQRCAHFGGQETSQMRCSILEIDTSYDRMVGDADCERHMFRTSHRFLEPH